MAAGDTCRELKDVRRSFEELEFTEKEKDAANICERNIPGPMYRRQRLTMAFGFDPDPRVLEPLFEGLTDTIKSSHYGKQVKLVLESAKKAPVGAIAPQFSVNDVNGKPISLASCKENIH